MMKLFGFIHGRCRAIIRYTDTGEVRFFINRLPAPTPARSMKPDEIMDAARSAQPVDSGMALDPDDVRAMQQATTLLIADMVDAPFRRKAK